MQLDSTHIDLGAACVFKDEAARHQANVSNFMKDGSE